MLSTNVAKVALAKSQDYFTKSLAVEMRTSVITEKLKMRISIVGNALLYGIAVAPAEALIAFKSLAVNTDLPADATAVLASIGDTFKIFIIFI